MTSIYEVTTKNGRIFRVLIENNNQEKRMYNTFLNGEFDTVTRVLNGIHNISDFEKLADMLKNKKVTQ